MPRGGSSSVVLMRIIGMSLFPPPEAGRRAGICPMRDLDSSASHGTFTATNFNPGISLKSFVLDVSTVKSRMDGLGCQPDVLDAEVRPAPRLRKFGRDHPEHLGGFAGDAKQRLATHPAQRGHRALPLLCVLHQADAKAHLGHVDGRKIDRLLPGDRMDVSRAESAPLDGDPESRVNQEAHGLRSSFSVPRLPFLPVATALASASAVLSSSVR